MTLSDADGPSHHESLEELVRATQAGDASARERLLERSLPALTAFVRRRIGRGLRSRETSQDLVQSVCREALEGLERFEYQGESSFERWLLSRAENKIRNRARFWRRDRRDAALEEPEGVAEQLASLLTPSRQLTTREELEQLEVAFASLSEDHREVILMARIAGLSHARVAKEMGRSEVAVRSLLVRALAELATRIE